MKQAEESIQEVGAIIQARMGSTRFPGKILEQIENWPMLWHLVERLKHSECVNKNIIIATTTLQRDQRIVEFVRENNVKIFCGDEKDVVERYIQAAEYYNIGIVVRITADNPLLDFRSIPDLVRLCQENADLAFITGLPIGVSVEVVKKSALIKAKDELKKFDERLKRHYHEHVTPFIMEKKDIFKVRYIHAPAEFKRLTYRLTVDTRDDLSLIREIYKRLYKQGNPIEIKDVIKLLDDKPELLKINAHVKQKRKLLLGTKDLLYGGDLQ